MNLKKMVLSLFFMTLIAKAGSVNVRRAVTDSLSTASPTPQTSFDLKPLSKTKSEKRLWNLRHADILTVIDQVSELVDKNFVVDPRVHGTISIVSSAALAPEEVYRVFLSALQVLGYSTVSEGHVIKILPNLDARQVGGSAGSKDHPPMDQVTVRVVAIQHVAADQLVPVLRPLLPQWATLSAYRPSNALIISGTALNIAHLLEVIRQVDRDENNAIDVIALKYAASVDVVKTLNYLQQASQIHGRAANLAISSDDRNNRVLLSGSPAERLRMRVIISEMDAKPSHYSNNAQVVYLHYLKASSLMDVLNGVGDGEENEEIGVGSAEKKGASPLPAHPASPWGKDVKIIAEPTSNALVIKAPPVLMQTIKNIIARLDIRPQQVLVEGVIAEVSESTLKQIGAQWGSQGRGRDQDRAEESSSAGLFDQITGGLGIGVVNAGDLKVLINLLHEDTSTNILSTPSLVVLNHQKAEIKVVKVISIVNGSYASTNASNTVQPFTTTTSKDVGLTLDVTPQVTQGSAVQLKIKQVNGTLVGTRMINNNPVYNNTLIQTSVIVDDGHVLVLGGLMSTELEKNTQKVPVLGRMPILGHLFKSTDNRLEKKNLLVFLRPTILHHGADNLRMSRSRYDFTRQLQLKKIWESGRKNLPLLPPWSGQERRLPEPFDDAS